MPSKELSTSKTSNSGFLLCLLMILTLSLGSCAKTLPSDTRPHWPKPGKEVAKELEDACYYKGVNHCPNIFEWLDKLYKLRDQLEA